MLDSIPQAKHCKHSRAGFYVSSQLLQAHKRWILSLKQSITSTAALDFYVSMLAPLLASVLLTSAMVTASLVSAELTSAMLATLLISVS